ncbi:tol-pal system protein YbgF [Thiotrichales bacterium 19S9-12]|nr:tol-pal system protein YbgF [Thiotrichales bacterium 19S9-11]MCF6811683.1 tol-pal system protein YbgF [Thiotrichales bacterium 19S9-12]
MKYNTVKFGLLLVAATSFSGYAHAATNQQLQDEVNQLNTKVRQLQNQISYLMDKLDSYDQYQSSIDALRNQIERNRHGVETTKMKISDDQKLYDQKMLALEKKLSSEINRVEKQKLRDPQDVVFDSAYELMLNRKYKDALSGFQNYINSYYNGRHYSESLYYIGVLHLAQGKVPQAKTRFKQIVNRYPKSIKYPDSLVQLGAIYQVEGDTKLAKSYFNKVIKNYPDTQAASLAKKELAKNK